MSRSRELVDHLHFRRQRSDAAAVQMVSKKLKLDFSKLTFCGVDDNVLVWHSLEQETGVDGMLLYTLSHPAMD